jgi:hypothetical protein
VIADSLFDPAAMSADQIDAEILALFATAALRVVADRRRMAPHLAPRGLVTAPLSKSRNEVDSSPGESLSVGG